MNVTQAAIELRISKQGVRKAISRGQLAATLTKGGPDGSFYVIDEDEVKRYAQRITRSRRNDADASAANG